MTIVPRLQNSSYRHQPEGKKKKTLKTYSVIYKCLNSDNIELYYCCTNLTNCIVIAN